MQKRAWYMRKKPSNFPKHYLSRYYYYILPITNKLWYKYDKTFEFGMELSNFWTIFMTYPTLTEKDSKQILRSAQRLHISLKKTLIKFKAINVMINPFRINYISRCRVQFVSLIKSLGLVEVLMKFVSFFDAK